MASTKQEFNLNSNTIAIVSALLRALSHKIRTPLSVISNDLSYLKTLLPNEDIDRDLTKVKLIAELLKNCTDSLNINESKTKLDINEISKELSDLGWLISSDKPAPLLELKLKTFLKIFHLINALETELTSSVSKQANTKMLLIKNNPTTFSFELNSPSLSEFSKKHGLRVFNDFTRLFCATLQLDLPYAPLIDLLLLELDISCTIKTMNPAQVELIMQKVEID